MKKSNRNRQQQTEWKQKPLITVGIDLGDRWSHYCMLNADGEVVEQGSVATTEAGIRRWSLRATAVTAVLLLIAHVYTEVHVYGGE